jgi:hypothetical protein
MRPTRASSAYGDAADVAIAVDEIDETVRVVHELREAGERCSGTVAGVASAMSSAASRDDASVGWR